MRREKSGTCGWEKNRKEWKFLYLWDIFFKKSSNKEEQTLGTCFLPPPVDIIRLSLHHLTQRLARPPPPGLVLSAFFFDFLCNWVAFWHAHARRHVWRSEKRSRGGCMTRVMVINRLACLWLHRIGDASYPPASLRPKCCWENVPEKSFPGQISALSQESC